MVDHVSELIDGMRDIRIRNAILVTALTRLGGSLTVTPRDAFAAAAHNIEVRPRAEGGFDVTLVQAPKEATHGR